MTMRCTIALLLTLLCTGAQAQALGLIARNTSDSIVLRWAPTGHVAWRANNVTGYRVERLLIDENTTRRTKWTPIGADRFVPLTLEQMKSRFAVDHPWAGAVAQLLHGAKGESVPSDLVPASQVADAQRMEWSMCMLMADMDAGMADALGLRCVDRSIAKDANYLYRVIAMDPTRPDTAVVAVNRAWGAEPIPHGPLIASDEREQEVQLRWEAPIAGAFSGYWVERSTDGNRWQRMHQRPFIPTSSTGELAGIIYWSDTTIVANYRPMKYRVLGITPFGEVSNEAPVIIAMGRDRTPPTAAAITEVKDERGKLVVHWEHRDPSPDLKGYLVEKSHASNGAYYPLHRDLLAPGTKRFADTSSFLLGENHYRIAAFDTSGNRMNSNPGYGFLIDSIAPAPPSGLTGRIDSSGAVTVKWRLGKEPDIMGYRVFFANAADHEFNNLTPLPIQDTVFTDTLQVRTLTKRIHYKVVAVDRNYNHSAFSGMLTLERPDLVAPVAPVFKHYNVTDTAVTIDFIGSTSADLKLHRLLRKAPGEETWKEVLVLPASDKRRSWTDRTMSGPAYYSYTMVAIDSAGNSSARAVPLNVRVHQKSKHAAAVQVKATRVDERTVQVSWQKAKGAVHHYVVYRALNDGAMVVMGHVSGSASTYSDIRLAGKGSYTYHVQAVFDDGLSSAVVQAASPVVVP